MILKKISHSIHYLPHEPVRDRPMLAYVRGDQFSLAIDAGNSAAHVDDFYAGLALAELPNPDFTVITHWHWDHTFGLHRVSGCSLALNKTNHFLQLEQEKFAQTGYLDFYKSDDPCFAKEYANTASVIIQQTDQQFETEYILDLGGITARMFHTLSPHSEDTLLIEIPEERVLFLGDATSEDFFNDGFMDLKKLSSLISVIEQSDCRHCLLSHTEPLLKTHLLDYLYRTIDSGAV